MKGVGYKTEKNMTYGHALIFANREIVTGYDLAPLNKIIHLRLDLFHL